jgi:hypothetical protein
MKNLFFLFILSLNAFSQTKVGGELIALHNDESEVLFAKVQSSVGKNYGPCEIPIKVVNKDFRGLIKDLIQRDMKHSILELENIETKSPTHKDCDHEKNTTRKQVKCLVKDLTREDVNKLVKLPANHSVYLQMNLEKKEVDYFKKVLRTDVNE